MDVKLSNSPLGASTDGFKEWYPLVLSVVEEILPIVGTTVDQRELVALASMRLSRFLQADPQALRRNLRRDLEQYLLHVCAPDLDLEHQASTGALTAAPLSNELKGSRVLIVDDSPMARRQIQFFLEREGYHVFQAKSGEEALWLTGEVDPDLILMDVSMDGISGFEACRKLVSAPENEGLPVIFLSAKGEREEVVKGLSCGAVDYIVKPFHPAESLTRVQTHLRVRKLSRLKEKHIQQLRHTNETKDRVLRAASHDLRNPIGAIAGLAGFLKDSGSNLSGTQKEIVESIEEASRGVVQMLNELLDTSAVNGGDLDLNLEEIDVHAMVGNVMRLFAAEAERKSIRLHGDFHHSPLLVYADRGQLRRVIDNLISNGLKFTPQGGEVKVTTAFSEDNKEWILSVSDTGPGVPEKEFDLLFKEFGKTSAKPTGGEKSTGLGLAICKRIATAHGGEIIPCNLSEGGACFTLSLPVTVVK